MGGALVGVVSCESLFHTVTSGLQSVAVFYYENGTARITCSFASGSLSSGCQVSLSLDSSTTTTININRSTILTHVHRVIRLYVCRSDKATEVVHYASIGRVPSSVEATDLDVTDALVLSGTLYKESYTPSKQIALIPLGTQ